MPAPGDIYQDNLLGLVEAYHAYGVPPSLLASLIHTESEGIPTARSRSGAIGIAQIKPQTARHLNVNPHDPHQSLDAAAFYLSNLATRMGSWDAAMAAYLRGPGRFRSDPTATMNQATPYIQKIKATQTALLPYDREYASILVPMSDEYPLPTERIGMPSLPTPKPVKRQQRLSVQRRALASVGGGSTSVGRAARME